MAGFFQDLLWVAGIWRSVLVMVLGLVASGAAIAYGVPAFPVVILFADLVVFWHLRMLAIERRREARLDEAAFRTAALELAVVKTQHRDRLAPAQASLPFSQWVEDIRAGRGA
ncbi:MAG: hypothetical protein KGK10_13600 [Rhodospirillales bacterium]|nr:hypothetical protein [Rhodospirillales bacterium]